MSKTSTYGKEKSLHTVAEPNTSMFGSVEIVEEIPQISFVPHGIGESFKSLQTDPKPSEKAATKADCPPELRPIIEAEKRRAAETAANLALYSAAISGVEANLLPLAKRSSRQFVNSMRVYIRAFIAQYMASAPTVLAQRTLCQGLPTPGAELYRPS
ncbi:EKA-like protein [Blumeria hordei DH14]|uniref:EKA-like protein n=1 Tax=Blumeria graminis f. sp. hordei (strain DH14) TaxID=546991 RepID=N1JDD2_BLUG1|nr:EKA-like protein [Blumeria hordei DH14]